MIVIVAFYGFAAAFVYFVMLGSTRSSRLDRPALVFCAAFGVLLAQPIKADGGYPASGIRILIFSTPRQAWPRLLTF